MFARFHFIPFGESKQAAVPIKVLRGEIGDRYSDGLQQYNGSYQCK